MKNLTNFLLGYILFTNVSLTIALTSSFYPVGMSSATGNDAPDWLGYSVSNAGDFNKDGYDDIVLGAYNKNTAKGSVYVVFGGDISTMTAALDVTTLNNGSPRGFTISGSIPNNQVGYSVSSAGDIDGDTYDDIIIGVPGQSISGPKGAAYVIYGKSGSSNIGLTFTASYSTSLPLTQGFMITGELSANLLGCSVSSAGNFNNDGYDDILIGAYGEASSLGAVYVIYGRDRASMGHISLQTQPLDPSTTGFKITGDGADDEFGYSVHGASDINNDGYDDIIIGAYGKNNKRGAVYVIYGGDESLMSNINLNTQPLDPSTTGFMISGNSVDDYFGWSVSNAGDVNKDGYDDIIIGAPRKNTVRAGVAYVIYGGKKSSMQNIDLSTTSLDPQSTGFMIFGSGFNDYFGSSVGCAGDVNNDGYNDTIIGAENKGSGKGAVHVIYGGPTPKMKDIDLLSVTLDPLTSGFSILGETTNGQFGKSVSSGYINKDQHSDLIIGAPMETSQKGTAYFVFSQCSAHCKKCDSPSKCTDCLSGYPLVKDKCIKCPQNCKICSSETSCTLCTVPYLLYDEKCWTTCPDATFQKDTKSCDDCPSWCSECTSLTNCQTCISGYSLTKSNLCEEIPKVEEEEIKEKDSEKAAAGVFEGSSLAGAALGSGSSLPLNFGLVAKLIRNFKYMKLPVSQELYETFVSWKVASGFMSAPDSWSEKYSSKELPIVFGRYKLQSAFLINFWKPLVMSLIGIALFGVFKVVEVSINDKKSKVYTISRQVNVAASNFALTQFYSNLDDVLFYFILEMKSTEFETGFRVLSSLLAIVLLLVGAIFIILHLKLIGKYQKLKEEGSSQQFEVKFENVNLIYKDFKDTNSLAQSFLMINVIRSVVASLIFATLFEYPMIQISFLFVLNILMIVFIWNKKSFKQFANTCGQLFCEGILFIANICVFLLALFDHADSYPMNSIKGLGKCIIILNFILLIGCAILLLFSLGKSLYQSYMDRKKPQSLSEEKKIFSSAKFNRPEESGFDQSLSTNNDLITESQDNSRFDSSYQNNVRLDSYKNNSPALRSANENHEKIQKMNYQEGNPDNNSIRTRQIKQKPTEGFKKSKTSNVILESSNQAGNSREETGLYSNHVLPRSRLMRNREITRARIAQFSENSAYGSPESRIQDPPFHSGMSLNQDEISVNQDVSLTNFEIGTESPPLRGKDFMPRRRQTHDNHGDRAVGRMRK